MEGALYDAEIRYLRLVNGRVDAWRDRYGKVPDRVALANIERGTRAEIDDAPSDSHVEVPIGKADAARHQEFVDLSLALWELEFELDHGRAPTANETQGAASTFEATAYLAQSADESLAPFEGPLDPPAQGDSVADAGAKWTRLVWRVRRRGPTADEDVHFMQDWLAGDASAVTELVNEGVRQASLPASPPPFDRPYEYARRLDRRLHDWRLSHDGAAPDHDTLAGLEDSVGQEVDRIAQGRPLPSLTKAQAAARSADFVEWSVETWRTEFESGNGRPPSESELAAARADIDFRAAATWSPEHYLEPSAAVAPPSAAVMPAPVAAAAVAPAAAPTRAPAQRTMLALLAGIVMVVLIAAAALFGRGGGGSPGAATPSPGGVAVGTPGGVAVGTPGGAATPAPAAASGPAPQTTLMASPSAGALDVCALIGGTFAEAILGTSATLVSTVGQCTITPAQPVKIDQVTYVQVVVTANTTGKPDSTSKYAAFGTKGIYGVTASSNSSFSTATGATPRPLLQKFVDRVIAGLPQQ